MKTSHILLAMLAAGGAWYVWKRNADAKLLAPAQLPGNVLPFPGPRRKCKSGSIPLT